MMSESIEIYNSVKTDNYIQFKNLFNKFIVTDDDIFNINYQSEVSEVICIIYTYNYIHVNIQELLFVRCF